MPRRNVAPDRPHRRPRPAAARPSPRTLPPPGTIKLAAPLLFIAGLLALDLAAIAALLLVLEHVAGISLPGCGAGSPCARAAAGPFGKLPLTAWPTSFAGFAYFTALTALWALGRGALSQPLRWVVRLGAIGSVVYLSIMLKEGYVCMYCVAVHVGNFAFVAFSEISRVRGAVPALHIARSPLSSLLLLAAVLGVISVPLGVVEAQAQQAQRQQSEDALRQDIQNLTGGGNSAASAPAAPRKPFTGRYRHGPADAPIRLVMFTDYQCADCRNIEQQIKQVLAQRQDVSLSTKHFPFCSKCNKHVSVDLHANACWAARAAEAAGILWGDEGFYKMHHWLFDREGKFETKEVLEAGIRSLGYDPAGFTTVMQGQETLRRVEQDVDEAVDLGLHFTPMIFINGVELKGWAAPNALVRAVDALAATNPPRGSAENDQPPRAAQKLIDDWAAGEKTPDLVPDKDCWPIGPAGAKVRVVVFGDYLEPGTIEADAAIRAFMAGRGDVRYVFRFFPVDKSCNPQAPDTKFNSCAATRAAIGAGLAGGAEAFAKLHNWILANRGKSSEAEIRAACAELALDPADVAAASARPEVLAIILRDARAVQQLGRRQYDQRMGQGGLPMIYVNERAVPRWKLDNRLILPEILERATRE